MSVVVYAEHAGGKFKKSTFEVLSYASAIASSMGSTVTAVSIGNVSNEELLQLSRYGANKILNVTLERLLTFTNQAYAAVIAAPNTNIKMILNRPAGPLAGDTLISVKSCAETGGAGAGCQQWVFVRRCARSQCGTSCAGGLQFANTPFAFVKQGQFEWV